jgi:hypothetical protein
MWHGYQTGSGDTSSGDVGSARCSKYDGGSRLSSTPGAPAGRTSPLPVQSLKSSRFSNDRLLLMPLFPPTPAASASTLLIIGAIVSSYRKNAISAMTAVCCACSSRAQGEAGRLAEDPAGAIREARGFDAAGLDEGADRGDAGCCASDNNADAGEVDIGVGARNRRGGVGGRVSPGETGKGKELKFDSSVTQVDEMAEVGGDTADRAEAGIDVRRGVLQGEAETGESESSGDGSANVGEDGDRFDHSYCRVGMTVRK